MRNVWPRLPFLLAVALIAAAIGDPLVETISNTGVFGRGYSDNNHLSVVPAFVAGASLIALLVCRRIVALLHRDRSERRDWLIAVATRIASGSILNDSPYVVVLQFAALFMMESCEQLVFTGRFAGGALWLGGPVLFSLVAHTLVTVASMLLVARAMRSIARGVHAIFAIVAYILLSCARTCRALFACRRDARALSQAQTLRVRQTGERAPPLLLSLT